MMKRKSILALILVFAMLSTMMPAWVFAEAGADASGNDAEGGSKVLMQESAAQDGVRQKDAAQDDAGPESEGQEDAAQGGATNGDTGDGELPPDGEPENLPQADSEDPDSKIPEDPDSKIPGEQPEEGPDGNLPDQQPEDDPGSSLKLSETYPLSLTGGTAIKVTMGTHRMNSNLHEFVSFKIKNNTNETIEDVTLIDSTKVDVARTDGDVEEKTPYDVNSDYEGNHEPVNATVNDFGYDIAPGETATFWLEVNSLDLHAGTHEHFIQLGKKEWRYEGWSRWSEVVATYSDKIPVELTLYDPPVKVTIGKLNSDFSVTAQDTLNFGTIDLKKEYEENNGAITDSLSFAVQNSSTAKDEVTGEVPDLHLSMDDANVYDKKYGRLPFDFSITHFSTWHDIGPGAPADFTLQLDASDMIAGTYYGAIRANVSPGVVTVNGTKNTSGWGGRWGWIDIPVKATLTGINQNLPKAVKNLKAQEGNGMVVLNWEDGEEFNGFYNIYRRDGKETEEDWTKYDYEPYENIGYVNTESGQKSYVDYTAKNDKTYSYIVIAGRGSNTEPYHGYPSNAVTATPDAAKERRLKAPDFEAYGQRGYVALFWELTTDDGSYSDPTGKDEIDHFNIYKNGRLAYQVAQNAVTESEYQDGNWEIQHEYGWGLDAYCTPGILYSWQIAAVDKNGVEGYMSDAVQEQATSTEPRIARVDAWFDGSASFDKNGDDGLYYDPKYGSGTGKGVFLCTRTADGYSDISFINIERKTLADGVDDGSDSGFSKIAECIPVNYVNVGAEPEFCDRTVAYGKTYKYRITGSTYDGETTNSYDIVVKTPSSSSTDYATFTQAEVNFSIKDNITPRLEFYVANEEGEGSTEFRVMRRDPGSTVFRTIKTYKGSLKTVVHYEETPLVDGIYTYRVDKVTNGVTTYGIEYFFLRDQTPVEESMLPKAPSAPDLRGMVLDGGDAYSDVMLRWSDTGGEEIDGYYIYRTDGDKYNTTGWSNSDGERAVDYPYYHNNRYIRLSPDKKTFRDREVYWYGDYDYENDKYSPVTHKWWIVAYNEMGMSEPSQIVVFEDQMRDGGDSSCVSPASDAGEKPGDPEIRKMVTEYSIDESYTYSGDPAELISQFQVTALWTESPEGGDVEYFETKIGKKGEDAWTEKIYAGNTYSRNTGGGLPEGAGEYEFSVTAVNAAGKSNTVKQSVIVHDVPKVDARVASEGSVELKWTAPVLEGGVNLREYEVWYCDKYNVWRKYETAADYIHTATVKNLDKDVEYKFRVTARCSDDIDRTSAERSVTPTGMAISLEAPTGLSYKVMDGHIYLMWTPPANGTVETYEYQYELKEDDDAYPWYDADENGRKWSNYMTMKGAVNTMWVWSNFTPGETRNVRIRGTNKSQEDHGSGKWSEPLEVTLSKKDAAKASVGQPEPIQPTVTGGEGKITLTWKSIPGPDEEKGLGPGASYYKISRRCAVENNGEAKIIDTVLGDPTATKAKTYTFVDEDVTPGVNYMYSITAATSTRESYPNHWYTGMATGVTETDNKLETIRDILKSLPAAGAITEANYESYGDKVDALRGLYAGLTSKAKSMLADQEQQTIETLIKAYDAAKARAEYGALIAAANEAMNKLPDAALLTPENAEEYQKAVDEVKKVLAKLPADALPGVDTTKLDAIVARFAEIRKIQADMKAAKKVSDMIALLPAATDVNLNHKNAIVAARAAYTGLTDDQKAYIKDDELKKLEDCEEALAPFLIADVVDRINNLPAAADITLANEDAVVAAREVYELLSEENKGKVSAELVQKLTDCEAAIHELKRVPLAKSMVVKKPAAKKYTGKALTTTFTMEYRGGKLVKDTDYTVKYSNNKNVGKATIKVTGIGDYKGSLTLSFKINPKGTKLSKVTPGRKKAKVTWKKVKTKMKKSHVTGYQIQYSLKSTFKGSRTVTVKGWKKTATTIKKLKGRKVYYFRVRTYMKTGGSNYYSSWSGKKKVRVKK